jgi:hypothetical protein
MEYKSTFTQEEAEEIIQWFKTHEYDNEVDIGEGQYIKNIKKCVNALTHTTLTQYKNSTFSGQIFNLFRIREELINQGKVKN